MKDNILLAEKRHLILANAIVWGAPGVRILVTDIQSYLSLGHTGKLFWLIPVSVLVLAGFVWMFERIVRKYTDRILAFQEKRKSLFAFLSVKGYVLILIMMCLGISLKFIPGGPVEFFASFYCGLGIALAVAAATFLKNWLEAK